MKHPIVNIIDLEMLCWDTKNESNPYQEIIEISIVEVSMKTLELKKEIQIYCKPSLGGKISIFCNELTGINQGKIDKSIYNLETAIELLVRKYGFNKRPLVSWGNDLSAIVKEFKKKGINFNPPQNNFDLSLIDSLINQKDKGTSLSKAMNEYGLEFEGQAHSGLIDARNTARLYIEFIKKHQKVI
jgi:inhibitor of KinA sporulation pathway (predicted exonuclease)